MTKKYKHNDGSTYTVLENSVPIVLDDPNSDCYYSLVLEKSKLEEMIKSGELVAETYADKIKNKAQAT